MSPKAASASRDRPPRGRGSGARVTKPATPTIEQLDYQLLDRRGNGGADSVTLVGDQGSLGAPRIMTCPPDQRQLRRAPDRHRHGQGIAVASRRHPAGRRVRCCTCPGSCSHRRTPAHRPAVPLDLQFQPCNGSTGGSPIYLNLAPNYDATLSPRIMTARASSSARSSATLVEGGGARWKAPTCPTTTLRAAIGHVHYTAFQNVASHWQARASVNWISDTRYFEDFSSSLDGLSHHHGLQRDRPTDATGWEAGDHRRPLATGDYRCPSRILPYDRLPARLSVGPSPGPACCIGALRRDRASSTSRPGAAPSMPSPGSACPARRCLVPDPHPRLSLHAIRPRRRAGAVARRLLAIARAVDLQRRWRPVLRPRDQVKGRTTCRRSNRASSTCRVPYTDQADMLLFDTQPLTFSWGQLFRDNRYSGADRQADANQLTLA